jgi:beta-lactamase class A
MPASRSHRAVRFLRLTVITAAMSGAAGALASVSGPVGASPVTRTAAAPASRGSTRPPVVAVSAPGPAAVSAPAPAAAPGRPVRPLRGIRGYLRTRQGVVQVAVYDRLTGRTYLLSNGPDTQYTASIVKADILARWLRRYQHKPGMIPASLPYSIQYLMTNMITVSDNSAATGLFYFGGGCAALTRFNRRIPTRDTNVGCQTPTYYGWGNTTTTAADQAAIMATFAYPNRVLTARARAYGLHLMESIVPAQRWGVTCGPWGTSCAPPDYASPVPGVTVALKNGWKFVPACLAQDDSCPWQVNSIGWIHGQGRDYVLTVLTTNDPAGPGTFGFDYGITTIQGVSQRIWANLAP